MQHIEHAILRTVLYGDIFDFPMTIQEIHHFLIHDESISLPDIESVLCSSPDLAKHLLIVGKYVARIGRQDIINLREAREQAAQDLWQNAVYYGRWLARLPFVRMVALTGALAMRNADPHDDLDYLLVTAPGRVWLARLFAIALVKVGKRRGVILCPNYVLAEDALAQTQRDLFIAHEIAQMVPLYGRPLYLHMRASNSWAEAHLPNANIAFYEESGLAIGKGWAIIKRATEILLSGWPGHLLERLERQRKIKRFSRIQTPRSAAQLDHSHVKGHFNDHGRPVLKAYYDRLQDYGLIDSPAPGD